MHITLKYTELMAVVELMERDIENCICISIQDAIVAVLVLKFLKQLKMKTVMAEPRAYRIKVEPETAMAFVTFYTSKAINPGSHAGNIILKLVSQFDKQTTIYHS